MIRYRKKWKEVVPMHIIPYVFVLLAAVCWGTTGTLQTFLIGDIEPISIAAIRSLIGGGILLLYLLITRKLSFKSWSWKWTIFAAVFIGLFQTAFFTSIQLTGVAIGTVITIGSAPIFAGLVEWLLFKHKPTWIWLTATLLAIIGVCLLFVQANQTSFHIGGVGCGLVAGILFACYTNFSKKLMEEQQALPAVAMTFTICAMLVMPFAAFEDGFKWLSQSPNLLVMLIMAVIATTLAYILFLSGLQKISSSAAVTLSLAEPLTAALLSVFIVKEMLPLLSWVGIGCIIIGIVIVTSVPKKS